MFLYFFGLDKYADNLISGKIDIIKISRDIDTYETSILPYEDCCTVFLPTFPAIKPNLEKVIKAEQKLDFEGLIEEAMKKIEKITL